MMICLINHCDVICAASLCEDGRAELCGRMASRYFSLAESLRSPMSYPFVWVFIRPPWSMSGGCCKAVVFDRLKEECDTNPVSSQMPSANQISKHVLC